MIVQRKSDPKVHIMAFIPFLPPFAVPHLSQKREGKRAPALAQCEHTVCFLRCEWNDSGAFNVQQRSTFRKKFRSFFCKGMALKKVIAKKHIFFFKKNHISDFTRNIFLFSNVTSKVATNLVFPPPNFFLQKQTFLKV